MRVLTIAHNHPALHPGGTEIFARDLTQTLREYEGVETFFLAATDRVHRPAPHPGTPFMAPSPLPDPALPAAEQLVPLDEVDPNEMLVHCDHFDWFSLENRHPHISILPITELLQSFQPDVVHFHHYLLLGLECLQLVRTGLPKSAVILTLHDFYGLCPNDGSMMKRRGGVRRCEAASIHGCATCFPEIGEARLRLRALAVRRAFSAVDAFVSPSQFLANRYKGSPVPADKLRILRNARPPLPKAEPRQDNAGRRPGRFAVFGNLSPLKGTLVALEAAQKLLANGFRDFRLDIYGAPQFQSDAFTAELDKAFEAVSPYAVRHGAYDREGLAAGLEETDWVIMPSVWWENAPLVIEEAFQARRPVLCSNIGGMAERVRDGVDGCHFDAGDAASLAALMSRCAGDRPLWTRLVRAIETPRTMQECAHEHLELYREVLATKG